MRPALSLAVDEHDQVPRLRRFRAAYPQVIIGVLEDRGTWQARIPEPGGETTITRYTLGSLLDKLDEIVPPPQDSG